jgi:transcription antitermination factor NusG
LPPAWEALDRRWARVLPITSLPEDGEALSVGASSTARMSSPLSPDGVAMPHPRWFAAYTTPRHEKAVARQLEARRIESFLPLYRTPRQRKNGCRVVVEQPLFPSYIFVCIPRRESVKVLEVPGVVSLVGAAREPSPLPPSEIESLRSGLILRQFEPHAYLVVGEKVRIVSGSLAGMAGVLVRKKNNLRVVLTLDLIRQSVAVEVGVDEIEPFPQ